MSVISTQAHLKVTENIIRHGNEFDMLEVTRPKGMLEYLVNMFTFGGVRKEKEELYNCVIRNLRNSFHDHNITLDNLQNVKAINIFSKGMHIKFEPNARAEETRIVVKKEGEEVSKLVPAHYFTSLCTSILVRDKLALSHENDLLMPSGEINLTDIHESSLSLPEIVSVMRDLPPQTKWIMSEEYNKTLDGLFNFIEKLDRNEKSAVAMASQVREQLGLNKNNDLLMPTGEINLTDIHESSLSLPEIVSVMRDLPPQTKWIMSEEYHKNLDSFFNFIEQLDRNEKSAVVMASQVREQLGLDKNSDLLMPSGEINLTDIHETTLDLAEVVSVLSNVPSQTKWILSEEYVDYLNKLLKYTESLEDNHNIKPSVSSEPEPQVNISPKTSTQNDTSRPVISWETTGAGPNVMPEYMTGSHSDSSTLDNDSFIEERESLYSTRRSFKDILATRPNALITTKA